MLNQRDLILKLLSTMSFVRSPTGHPVQTAAPTRKPCEDIDCPDGASHRIVLSLFLEATTSISPHQLTSRPIFVSSTSLARTATAAVHSRSVLTSCLPTTRHLLHSFLLIRLMSTYPFWTASRQRRQVVTGLQRVPAKLPLRTPRLALGWDGRNLRTTRYFSRSCKLWPLND